MNKNLEHFNLKDRAEIIHGDVLHSEIFNLKDDKTELKPFDYTISNPPFGVQSIENADLNFLKLAFKYTEEGIFSMHKTSTKDFLIKVFEENKFSVLDVKDIKFNIPKTYKFHKEESKNIDVSFFHAINKEYL